LQAAFEGAEQKGDQNGKGKNALPGKGFIVSPVRADEVGRMEQF
jgi:hypothetical protein